MKAKVQRDQKVAELTDLYWDGKPRKCSQDRAANVRLPYSR